MNTTSLSNYKGIDEPEANPSINRQRARSTSFDFQVDEKRKILDQENHENV